MYSLLIFGGKPSKSVRTNNLIYSHNLTDIINNQLKCNNTDNSPILVSGYIKKTFQNESDIYIPIGILQIIQYFCGLIYIEKKLDNICARSGHNGRIIHIKNMPYLIIHIWWK